MSFSELNQPVEFRIINFQNPIRKGRFCTAGGWTGFEGKKQCQSLIVWHCQIAITTAGKSAADSPAVCLNVQVANRLGMRLDELAARVDRVAHEHVESPV